MINESWSSASSALTAHRSVTEIKYIRGDHTRDHVGYEVPVAGCIQDGEALGLSPQLPLSDVYGHPVLPLTLALIHHPGEGKGALALLLGLLFVLVDGALGHATRFIQQVT